MLFSMPTCQSMAQTATDPLWEKAVVDGTMKYIGEFKKQKDRMIATAGMQGAMALEYNGIKNWQQKYNDYLKDKGYAEAVMAATTIYSDAVKVIHNIIRLQKVMSRNPQGIAASMAIDNLYVETVTEFIKTFRMVKFAISTGGEHNMLTGKERVDMLWTLVDRLSELNNKLHKLIISTACYNIADVWAIYTRGFNRFRHGTIAEQCRQKWHNNFKTMAIIYN